jgi:hypothetical protein
MIANLISLIKMKPNGPACDLPCDPNILPVLALPGGDRLANCTGKELA